MPVRTIASVGLVALAALVAFFLPVAGVILAAGALLLGLAARREQDPAGNAAIVLALVALVFTVAVLLRLISL